MQATRVAAVDRSSRRCARVGKQLEGEVKDVLEMQDAVARDVVEQIRLRLTADEKTFSAPEFRRGYIYSAFRWRLLQRSFPSTRNMEKEAKSPGPKPAKVRIGVFLPTVRNWQLSSLGSTKAEYDSYHCRAE